VPVAIDGIGATGIASIRAVRLSADRGVSSRGHALSPVPLNQVFRAPTEAVSAGFSSWPASPRLG
jgi:hypothetical protein